MAQIGTFELGKAEIGRSLNQLYTVAFSAALVPFDATESRLTARSLDASLPSCDAIYTRLIARAMLGSLTFSPALTRTIQKSLAAALPRFRGLLRWLLHDPNAIPYPMRRLVLGPSARSWPLYPADRSWFVPLDENTMITTTKDPDSLEDFELTWTPVVGADHITASVWKVPNGLTLTSSSFTATTSTARLSGGKLGVVYHVKNLVTLVSGQIKPRTIQITLQLE